jgi:hypothetical protein
VDVEGTIQFILESQAKAEAHMGAMDGRPGVLDARLDSITKLIKQGMRLLVTFQTETNSKINALADAQLRTDAKLDRVAEAQLRTDAKLEELAEAQKVTELKLQLLFDTLRKNRNGDQL